MTEGKTLVMVEHDMGVVFGLADRISVLVYGEVLATGTPEEIRANAAVQEAYLGIDRTRKRDAPCLKCATCTPTTARATSCTACISTCGEGEIVSLLGRNGVGRSTTIKAIMGLVDCTRLGEVQGRGDGRPQGLRDRAPGPGLRAGEPRHLSHAHGAPEPAARPEERPAPAARWSMDDMYELFPRLKERADTRPACSPAASSRCSRCAAR